MVVKNKKSGISSVQCWSTFPTMTQHRALTLNSSSVTRSYKQTPANTKHLYNICTTSAQRLRRWTNIVQMLYKCLCLLGSIPKPIVWVQTTHIILITIPILMWCTWQKYKNIIFDYLLSRESSCGGNPCDEATSQTRVCVGDGPVNCRYGNWGKWGVCDQATCDMGGERTRHRNVM